MQLGKNVKITRVSNAVAAGTSDVTCSEINMAGYEGVLFMVAFGTITSGAVTSIKAQQDIVTGMANAADLTGTGVTVADTSSNKVFWLDIYKPEEQFVRCIIDRGIQNAVVDGVWAIQYGAHKVPTTHDSTTVGGGEAHASPEEGTA